MSSSRLPVRHVVRTRFGSGVTGPSYQRLIRVDLRHGFYNAAGGKCDDFEIRPTAATTAVMQSLGLLFRDDGASFSVLSDATREKDLIDYVDRNQKQAGTVPRLSFLLTPTNPYFVNFTDMPVIYSPSQACYYFSNTDAKKTTVAIVLDPDFPDELPLRPTGSQCAVEVVSPATKCVTLQDYWGNVVVKQDVPGAARPQQVFLSLASLAEGSYTVGECSTACKDCTRTSIAQQGKVLYIVSSSQPFCMIDLFLADPGTGADTYPVTKSHADPTEYLLQFQPRQTTWNYYVVSQGAQLQGLKIVQEPVSGAVVAPKKVNFQGPEPVVLPTLQTAAKFVSKKTIPLLQQSTYSFQLRGQIGFEEVRNGVLVSRMPVASCRQVIPGASDFATGGRGRLSPVTTSPSQEFSDIYVYV